MSGFGASVGNAITGPGPHGARPGEPAIWRPLHVIW
jgi:hypothetical protein